MTEHNDISAATEEALTKRAVEFIRTNDPFGDQFSTRDLQILAGEPTNLEDRYENCPCGGNDCSAVPGGPLLGCPYVEDRAVTDASEADIKLAYVKRWRTIVKLPAKYADEIVAALRITGDAQAPLEPVAWQVFDTNAGWLHIPDSLADSYRKEGEKVRPLYAHPPFSAKQNLQELLEESRAALARIDAAPPPAAPIETDWFDECSKQAGRAFHYWSVLDQIKDRLGGPADAQLYDIRQLVETALAAQHPAAPVQCSSAGNVEVPTDALINLVNYQEQCDEDGVMVKVSRQALAEVLVYVQLVRPDLNGEPQAVPTREDRLETERNALQNSYGGGAFKDGMITLRIAEIDKELVALALSRPQSGGK